ncbi:hypothetical protein RchiOBHm_Chr5g0045581 [Rosa chinensis]|uniref:Uncharacterized protein n=1 Tax=Rosa chinensis TaxID=74649 RepID=A0A2P6QDW9_ROSCH|nr:hypothetical protein RchiOBHm_Chr5g0045581 [Rosa chinensis]
MRRMNFGEVKWFLARKKKWRKKGKRAAQRAASILWCGCSWSPLPWLQREKGIYMA